MPVTNLRNLSNLSNLVHEGQTVLSARQLNRQAQAADHYHRHQARGEPIPQDRPHLRDLGTIKVRCSSNLAGGSVVGIGTPTIDPLDRQNMWFEGVSADP